jgi:tetratricopeptide (TPR) repeat protein
LALLIAAVLQSLEPSVVKLERLQGRELWTVRATECSVAALLTRVAELSGLGIEATTALERAPRITLTLHRRPLEEVLEFALGSAGLRFELEDPSVDLAGDARLLVRADDGGRETPEQRASLAAAAWARARERHPRHPVAATARLAQGELAELRGQSGQARQRYLDLMAFAPASPSTAEAYLRAGRLAADAGDFGEASEHFRALANLTDADEYHPVARVELARATLSLGDAAGALHILESLETSHPCWERTEYTARLLARVEALLALRRFQDALLELESGAHELDPLGEQELPRLRARALEGAGYPLEASRAWLLVARGALATERIGAYQSAARLCEEADDPMGVLFVAREAQAAGFGTSVAEPERRARAALGVAAPKTAGAERAPARLAMAEVWLEQGAFEAATVELDALFRERELLALAPELRARLALAWARCQVLSSGLENALATLRGERLHLETPQALSALDRGAAELLEAQGLFERAADAYLGDY